MIILSVYNFIMSGYQKFISHRIKQIKQIFSFALGETNPCNPLNQMKNMGFICLYSCYISGSTQTSGETGIIWCLFVICLLNFVF